MSNIVVPVLGESIVEARIAKWLKKPGDHVEVGDPLVELETEKTNLELSAEKRGVITSIARKEGEDVKIGELLAVVDENGAGASPAAGQSGNGSKAAAAPAAAPPPTDQAAAAAAAESPKATPTARRMAEDHEVDLGGVPGTGSAGRVTKQDVQNAIAPHAPTSGSGFAPTRDTLAPSSGSAIAPTGSKIPPTTARPLAPTRIGDRTEARVRMTKRRQTIARRLVEAQQTAAMLTTFNEADMTQIMALRERRKESFKKEFGVGLGIASFFVKASIAALRAFPALNAEIQGEEIVYKHYFDIGMAVGAEGGLVVPVIRDADRMTFPQIELAIREFAKKAHDGTLTLDDLRGGTFTITNGGVFGSLLSTPILNPPQVAILGLHKIQDRVVPVNGQPAIRPMMYLALSYDHRIVDGREAVQFLVKAKEYIEDPANLLLEG
ncbi:MAG TPA: 2-oxoglutarate dehydrogenase complex dihydrolipoyllysine-residue succinyltransferase [Vicinamibacterales bacterium]|nr:2-oxoglutarate dehydrogenase complex dihydrolipoyllysine-residue succinyltransferase [Vicinamibacterales bacterium]